MFYSVFATLLGLVTLINSSPSQSFRVINRYAKSDNTLSTTVNMNHNSSNAYFYYDNSSTSHDFMQLDLYKDRVYIYSEANIGYLEWTLDRINNGQDFYFNFKSVNSLEQRFNLQVLVDFKVYYQTTEDYIYEKTFVIDYSLEDYRTNYSFIEDEATTNMTLLNAYQGLLEGEIYLTYVPLDENYFNSIESYNNGYNSGYEDGYNVGTDDGYSNGYQNGYIAGYNEGASQDATAVAIFSGIISVGLIPINFFLACLNFEVFGINIGAFVSALLTIAIVVIITRMIINGGSGGDK